MAETARKRKKQPKEGTGGNASQYGGVSPFEYIPNETGDGKNRGGVRGDYGKTIDGGELEPAVFTVDATSPIPGEAPQPAMPKKVEPTAKVETPAPAPIDRSVSRQEDRPQDSAPDPTPAPTPEPAPAPVPEEKPKQETANAPAESTPATSTVPVSKPQQAQAKKNLQPTTSNKPAPAPATAVTPQPAPAPAPSPSPEKKEETPAPAPQAQPAVPQPAQESAPDNTFASDKQQNYPSAGVPSAEQPEQKEQTYNLSAEEAVARVNAPAQPAVVPAGMEDLSASMLQYDEMLAEWEKMRQRQLEELQAKEAEKAKEDYNAQAWAGATEAASTIANLIGTVHGAESQTIRPTHETFFQKADAARREREQKREGYRSQLQQIQMQRAQLRANYASQQQERELKLFEIQRKQQEDAYNRQIGMLKLQLDEADKAKQRAIQQQNADTSAMRARATANSAADKNATRQERAAKTAEDHKKDIINARAKVASELEKSKGRTPTASEIDAAFEARYPEWASERKSWTASGKKEEKPASKPSNNSSQEHKGPMKPEETAGGAAKSIFG